MQTSGCQFLFWLLLVIFSIPRVRTEANAVSIRNDKKDDPAYATYDPFWDDYKYISFMTFFAASCAMFLLNCFADQMPRQTKYPRPKVGYRIFIIKYINNYVYSYRLKFLKPLPVFYQKSHIPGLINWPGKAIANHWKRMIYGT